MYKKLILIMFMFAQVKLQSSDSSKKNNCVPLTVLNSSTAACLNQASPQFCLGTELSNPSSCSYSQLPHDEQTPISEQVSLLCIENVDKDIQVAMPSVSVVLGINAQLMLEEDQLRKALIHSADVVFANLAKSVTLEKKKLRKLAQIINARKDIVRAFREQHPRSPLDATQLCPVTGEIFDIKTYKTISDIPNYFVRK